MSEDFVSDKAVIRYLERVYGVDIQSLRKRIAHKTRAAREAGASSVVSDGVRYFIGKDGGVTTVAGLEQPISNRGLRWKRKRL